MTTEFLIIMTRCNLDLFPGKFPFFVNLILKIGFRGWRDLVQELGLLKWAELHVSSLKMVADVLKSNFFLFIGTLYISLDEEYLYDVDDNITEMLTLISSSKACHLKCLKISRLRVDPDALGKAVCNVPTAEIDKIYWKSSGELEHFLNQIISSESLKLQSLIIKTNLKKDDGILLGIDPFLLGIVAVKMKYLKASVDVRTAEAILVLIGQCMDVKLQDLILDIWIRQNLDFYDIYEDEIIMAETKVDNLIIRILSVQGDDIACGHHRPTPYCASCGKGFYLLDYI